MYQPIVDLLEFLRAETIADRFYRVLVIPFGVKAAVDSGIEDEISDSQIIVVENRIFLCPLVLKHDYEIVLKNLDIVGVPLVIGSDDLLLAHLHTSQQFVKPSGA